MSNPGLAVNGVLGDGLVNYLAIGHAFVAGTTSHRICGIADGIKISSSLGRGRNTSPQPPDL
jgi:hypothetical protein